MKTISLDVLQPGRARKKFFTHCLTVKSAVLFYICQVLTKKTFSLWYLRFSRVRNEKSKKMDGKSSFSSFEPRESSQE